MKTLPLLEQRADPYVYRHSNGKYYFTASVPAFDFIELRSADTLEGLSSAQPRVVWTRHAEGPMSKNIWAPEIHYLKGKWYIFFAAAQDDADPRGCFDHRTYVLVNPNADPMEGEFTELLQLKTDWETFTLDSTVLINKGETYLIWAQRDPAIDSNSNLYIARMPEPGVLELPGVMLTQPEYEWECLGFRVNEGPSVLHHGGKLYLTYSGSATDERYAMGLLAADENADLLDPASWKKSPVPVMVTEPKNNLYGPGHNSFTKDEAGNDVLVFHARPYPGFKGGALSDPNRHAFLRWLEYDENDEPVFQDVNGLA